MMICFTYAALGALNKNIVQNHIALLNVFQYLNGRYIAYFYLSDAKIVWIKPFTFSKISARKKAPQNSR